MNKTTSPPRQVQALRTFASVAAMLDVAYPMIPLSPANVMLRALRDERGDPWFLAFDVGAALGLTLAQVRDDSALSDDQYRALGVRTPGGLAHEILLVSEWALHSLAMWGGDRNETEETIASEMYQQWISIDIVPEFMKLSPDLRLKMAMRPWLSAEASRQRKSITTLEVMKGALHVGGPVIDAELVPDGDGIVWNYFMHQERPRWTTVC